MKNVEKIQLATFYTENDSNKFLASLSPSQVVDVKVFYEYEKKCLSYTILFNVSSSLNL